MPSMSVNGAAYGLPIERRRNGAQHCAAGARLVGERKSADGLLVDVVRRGQELQTLTVRTTRRAGCVRLCRATTAEARDRRPLRHQHARAGTERSRS